MYNEILGLRMLGRDKLTLVMVAKDSEDRNYRKMKQLVPTKNDCKLSH